MLQNVYIEITSGDLSTSVKNECGESGCTSCPTVEFIDGSGDQAGYAGYYMYDVYNQHYKEIPINIKPAVMKDKLIKNFYFDNCSESDKKLQNKI